MSDGSGEAGFIGTQPAVQIGAGNPEAQKYGRMWEHEAYRAVSPGMSCIPLFLEQANPLPGSEVLDLGCGTGQAGLLLAILRPGLKVTFVDFVANCLDPDIRNALTTQADVLRFIKADLTRPLPIAAPYALCCDVMEHIPPQQVDTVLNVVLHAAR